MYRAAEVSNKVIVDGDRPWSLVADEDIITIWHALNVEPADPRATELRQRLQPEMLRDHGIDDKRQRNIGAERLWRDWPPRQA
ncbi:MAG: hypothetical protein M3Q31_05645 [Actinomycetota bacterium]|nr:hypothetical protein [Actinomycetota bacterium]